MRLILVIIAMGTGAHLWHSDFSEAGTPTQNPEGTSEINSSFEDDLIPKKKPQFWDIKFWKSCGTNQPRGKKEHTLRSQEKCTEDLSCIPNSMYFAIFFTVLSSYFKNVSDKQSKGLNDEV